MKKYVIRDSEAGNSIATFNSYEEAVKELEAYEAEDQREGTFTPDFYEIVEEESDKLYGLETERNGDVFIDWYTSKNDAIYFHKESPDTELWSHEVIGVYATIDEADEKLDDEPAGVCWTQVKVNGKWYVIEVDGDGVEE